MRPLGGAAPPLPEMSVCVAMGADDFIVYLPAIDEPLLRLGMLGALNIAMQTRSPIDVFYGLPNGAQIGRAHV